MQVFQCAGCPSGPCLFSCIDPEFWIGDECPANKTGVVSRNMAVWRRLEVVDCEPVATTINHCRACSYGHQDPEGGVSCQCEDDVCPITKERF